MEDNKTPRPLSDEELKQVAGGDFPKREISSVGFEECQESCRRRGPGLWPVIRDGLCYCDKKQLRQ